MSMRETSSIQRLFSFLVIIFSIFLLPSPTITTTPTHYRQRGQQQRSSSKRRRKLQPPAQPKPSSWELFRNLLSCKQIDHNPAAATPKKRTTSTSTSTSNKHGYVRLASCSSLCTLDDAIEHNGRRVVHRQDSRPHTRGSRHRHPNDSAPPATSASRMPFRRLSGCYECRMVVDPSRYPMGRPSICACPDCGELFLRPDDLEAHQAVRHAVSEIGPEDSGRNIVEIIFQSSWLKKDSPVCIVDRILRVHNTQKIINRFESYRDMVKCRAGRQNPRCIADGNELLRFHCTTFACSIGSRGSTSLCGMGPCCGVCSTIRNGFSAKMDGGRGLCTTATSGRAHDCMVVTREGEMNSRGQRAMLVCRVIAGRVQNRGPKSVVALEDEEEEDEKENASRSTRERFDSVMGTNGVYSNVDELFVFNPKAILPCFVVIYRVHQ